MRSKLSAYVNGFKHGFQWSSRRPEEWRQRAEEVVRPFSMAIRRLGHNDLRNQLQSARTIVEQQQSELLRQAVQLSSMKTDLTTQRKAIDHLNNQVNALQIKLAQVLPTTHGTTGQSGPLGPAKRSSGTKRNERSDERQQSRTDH